MQVLPHSSSSPISTLAGVYDMANIPSGPLVEYVDDEVALPWWHDLLTGPPQWKGRYLHLPTGLVTSEVGKHRSRDRWKRC